MTLIYLHLPLWHLGPVLPQLGLYPFRMAPGGGAMAWKRQGLPRHALWRLRRFLDLPALLPVIVSQPFFTCAGSAWNSEATNDQQPQFI